MGAVVADFELGGGGTEDVREFFQGGDPGGIVVLGGNVGTNPQDGSGLEYFSIQVSTRAYREAAKEMGIQELGTPLIVRGNGGSRLRGDWGIRHEESKYGRTVYCDATDSGPL